MSNVAESSVTIPGVVAVVDSGLARVAAHDPWSGLPTLRVTRISRASATQRAGRAGRTRPGRCLRLYTKHDFETRAMAERSGLWDRMGRERLFFNLESAVSKYEAQPPAPTAAPAG